MRVAERIERGLYALSKRLGRAPAVARLYARLDSQHAARTEERASATAPRVAIAVTVAAMIGLCAFFYASVAKILDWPPAAYGSAQVFNMSREGVRWDTYYGFSESCGAIDCLLSRATPVERYQKSVVLPLHEFPLLDYKRGQVIYHRAELRLPQRLMAETDVLVFHSVYIWAESYEFYVNDQLIDRGSQGLLNIAIPRALIPPDGRLTLAFRIDPGALPNQGLTHYGELVIGPKQLLAPISFTAREIRTTYHLWYVLPRISVCVLFCFLFLAMRKNRENFLFFLFVLLSSVRVFLLTEYADELLPTSVSGIALARLLGPFESIVFVMFVEQYFRRHRPQLARFATFSVLGLGAVIGGAHLVYGEARAAVLVKELGYWLRLAALTYAAYLAASTTLYLAQNRKSPIRLHSALFLTIFLGFSVIAQVGDVAALLPPRLGRVFQNMHELLLCFVLAGLVAFEFGSTVNQRDNIKRRLRTVVDPKIADQLLEKPETLKGQARDVTLLFTDIRSFTTICEVYPAEEVVEMLNTYLDTMVGVIQAHGGVVDKFIGDAIMAVWGAPVAGKEDATNAARCAIAMRKALASFNAARAANGQFELSIGIGLHTGRVIAGGVGSEQRFDYTVIGDTVNVAARVESMTKELGADIVVSDTTLVGIRGVALSSPCGDFTLKGKRDALSIHRLIGIFDAAGVLACHDAVYERLALPKEPGVVASVPPNLAKREYGPRRAA